MKTNSSKRLIALGKLMMASCLMLALMAPSVASAEEKYTLIKMPMIVKESEYGQIAFALPSQMNVEGDVLQVLNYTNGRVIKAPIFVNESKVTLHLLYPCQSQQRMLETPELKNHIESYDSIIKEANYSEELLGISGKPAIWGLIGGNILAAYQPTNQTIALIIMDANLGERTLAEFLGNFSITLANGITPLLPGYCPDTTSAPAEETAAGDSQETATASGTDAKDSAAATESTSAQPATGKDKMSTDINAAKEQIEKLKKSI